MDNKRLIEINKAIREHQVERVGRRLRSAMTAMKTIKSVELLKETPLV